MVPRQPHKLENQVQFLAAQPLSLNLIRMTNTPKEKKAKEQGKKRSSKWPKARKEFLAKNKSCAVCGGKKKLEVHHIKPFHAHPELELDPSNLIILCEGQKEVNCHLWFGHLGNYQSFNENIVKDAADWSDKVKNRPKS